MLKLRQVSAKDCRTVWRWSNDPEVRTVSFSPEPIPYKQHSAWFESKLHDPACFFYIAENREHESVGQVRCERKGSEATISVSVDRKFRSRGYGSLLLCLASQKLFEDSDIEVINAYIKLGNEASLSAVKKAGFVQLETTLKSGNNVYHLVLRREELT